MELLFLLFPVSFLILSRNSLCIFVMISLSVFSPYFSLIYSYLFGDTVPVKNIAVGVSLSCSKFPTLHMFLFFFLHSKQYPHSTSMYLSLSSVQTGGSYPFFFCRYEPFVFDFYWKIAHYLLGMNDDNVLIPPYIHSLRLFFSSMFNFWPLLS